MKLMQMTVICWYSTHNIGTAHITNIGCSMQFKEIITVYTEHHTRHTKRAAQIKLKAP